jgi:opacity protein-like surface antigen
MRLFLLTFTTVITAWAQPFSIGVKGGVPLTDFFQTVSNPTVSFHSSTTRYIVGPAFELRLPAGFGIEFDVLYRRLNFSSTANLVDVFTQSRTTGNAWEFPLVLKKKFGRGPLKPYLEGGVAFDRLSGFEQVTTRLFAGRNSATSKGPPTELRDNFSTGAVVGAGIELHALFLRVSPEIRYTHWGVEQFRDTLGLLRSNQNQTEFLVGITF